MSYSGWKATRKSAGALQLDPANPRIPPSSKTLSQSELITELVTHDDVYQLALNIQANGFFPTEPLVAIREKGKYYVAEGNRRLAACKLLANPDAAPEDFRSRFKLLSAKMSDARIVDELFLATLSRLPDEGEKMSALDRVSAASDREAGLADVVWALVNTREFILNH